MEFGGTTTVLLGIEQVALEPKEEDDSTRSRTKRSL